MIWGLEARHIYIPPGSGLSAATVAGYTPSQVAAVGGVILNRWTADDGSRDRVYPHYRCRKIGGLKSTGESGDVRDGRVGAAGEIPRRSYRGGKTITYEGSTVATSRPDLAIAEQALDTAFDDQNGEGLVVVKPHPVNPDYAAQYRWFLARALTCEIDDSPTVRSNRPSYGHESTFVVALRNARTAGYSYTDQSGTHFK